MAAWVITMPDSGDVKAKAQRYVADAVLDLKGNDLDGALDKLNLAVDADSTSAEAYRYRGIVHAKRRDFDGAIADFDQAARLKPKDADIYYFRGLSWQHKGNLKRAVEDYDRVLALNPGHAKAREKRILLGDQLGIARPLPAPRAAPPRSEGTIAGKASAEKTLENSTQAEGRYSNLLVKDICRDEILRKFVQEKKINYYRSKFEQMIEGSGVGNQKIADVDVSFVYRWRRWNWSAFFALIFWGAWRGVAHIWWLVAVYCIAYLTLDTVFNVSGIIGSAAASKLSLVYGISICVLCGLFGNSLFLAKIVDELKSGRIRQEQTSAKNLWLVISLYVGIALVDSLLFLPSKMAGIGMDVANYHAAMAKLYNSAENKEPSQSIVSQTRQQLSWCNHEGGATPDQRINGCTAEVESGKHAGADLAGVFSNRGGAYNDKGQYDRAIADYDQAIRLDPKNAIAFSNRGVAYDNKGDHNRAMADLNEAIRLDANYADAFRNRGTVYLHKGDSDRAMADLNEAIRLNPKSVGAFINRGAAYYDKGDYDRAIANYDQAIRLDPKSAAAFSNRGNAYIMKGDYDNAIANHSEAIRLNPKNADFIYNRGGAYLRKNDYDTAIADFDLAIRLRPAFTLAINNRAKAVAIVQKLKDSEDEPEVEEHPERPATTTSGLDIKGWRLGVSLEELERRWNGCHDEGSFRALMCRGYNEQSGYGGGSGFVFFYSTGLDPKVWKISYNFPGQSCAALISDVKAKYGVGEPKRSGAAVVWEVGTELLGLSPTLMGAAGCHLFIADLKTVANDAQSSKCQAADKKLCAFLEGMNSLLDF